MKKLLMILILFGTLNCYAVNKIDANFIMNCTSGTGMFLTTIKQDGVSIDKDNRYPGCNAWTYHIQSNRVTVGANKINFAFRTAGSYATAEGVLKKDASCANTYLDLDFSSPVSVCGYGYSQLNFPSDINKNSGVHKFNADITTYEEPLRYLLPHGYLPPGCGGYAQAGKAVYKISNCKYEFIEESKL